MGSRLGIGFDGVKRLEEELLECIDVAVDGWLEFEVELRMVIEVDFG